MALNINKIKADWLPADQFNSEIVEDKRMIVLHHTASGVGSEGDVNTWERTPEKVATAFLVERNGQIVQCFNSKQWAYHLASKFHNWPQHDRKSIGIEIDSWGWLTKKGDKFFSWAGVEVAAENVQYYPEKFRGQHYYEKYTPDQIQATKDLLVYLGQKFSIPLKYNYVDMFQVSDRARWLDAGIYGHCSFRADKSDVHPQPELIAMLESIAVK